VEVGARTRDGRGEEGRERKGLVGGGYAPRQTLVSALQLRYPIFSDRCRILE